MAEALDPKRQILRQWLEDPAIEYTLRALSRHTGLRHLPLMRAMAELMRDRLIAARPNTHFAIFHLSKGTRARDALKAVHDTEVKGRKP